MADPACVSKIIEDDAIAMIRLHLAEKNNRMMRHTKRTFKDMMKKLQPVKAVVGLTGEPYRLSLVNNNIWIRKSIDQMAVYKTEDLTTIGNELEHDLKWIKVVLQVGENEILVASDTGLYSCQMDLKMPKKIHNSVFSDLTPDGDKVVAIDSTQNIVVYFAKDTENNKWKEHHQFELNDGGEKNKVKTMLKVNEDLFICVHGSHKIQKYHRSELIDENGGPGSDMGMFKSPYICGVDENSRLLICDRDNGRIQLMNTSGQCDEIKIDGVKWPKDVIVLDEFLFVLHEGDDCKLRSLSKFKIIESCKDTCKTQKHE